MKVHLRGSVKTWDDLQIGILFGVRFGDDVVLGMKASGAVREGEKVERCILLTPGSQDGVPSVYDYAHLQDLPLLEMPDAFFVPGQLSSKAYPDPGDLVQTTEGPILTVLHAHDHGRRTLPSVYLVSGEYSTTRPDRNYVSFEGWRIFLPSPVEGEADRIIFEWPRPQVMASVAA